MLTVGKDAREVERKLRTGRFACPLCGGRLAPWSHGRTRVVFGEGALRWRLRPRRARCAQCGVTHVLLPVSVLARRRDEAGVIGAALGLAAGGVSCAAIARSLGRPAGLVRGWVRRLAGRAGQVRAVFTVLVVALDPDPPPIGPAGRRWVMRSLRSRRPRRRSRAGSWLRCRRGSWRLRSRRGACWRR